MAKNAIREYSSTAASNTDIAGIGIQGSNAVSNFDNAFRTIMAQLADMNGGVSPINDTFLLCDPADPTKRVRIDAGSITTATTRVLTMPNFDLTLGNAAGQTIGTSGATVPLLNGNNTHSGSNKFTGQFNIQSADGSHKEIWFQDTVTNTNRGRVFKDDGSDPGMVLMNYSDVGAAGTAAGFRESGWAQWTGHIDILGGGYNGNKEHRFYVDTDTFFRWVYLTDGSAVFQRSASSNFTSNTDLLVVQTDNRIVVPTLSATSIRILADNAEGLRLGDNAYLMDTNQADGMRLVGLQNGNNGWLYFGSSADRLGCTGADGILRWGTAGFVMQTDGNMYLPMYSDFLSNVINAKAGVYTGSNANETVFPIGHFLIASGNIDRNAATSVWHNSGNNLDYTTTASGSQLAGTYRGRGRPGSGFTGLARTA